MPRNTIICGDAAQELARLRAGSVDLLIADPPYNLGKDYGNNRDEKDWAAYGTFTRAWLTEAVRVLKPTGSSYVFMGVRFISKLFGILEDDFQLLLRERFAGDAPAEGRDSDEGLPVEDWHHHLRVGPAVGIANGEKSKSPCCWDFYTCCNSRSCRRVSDLISSWSKIKRWGNVESSRW